MRDSRRVKAWVQVPDKFYKGGSQEKYLSRGRIFSCFPAYVIEQDLF